MKKIHNERLIGFTKQKTKKRKPESEWIFSFHMKMPQISAEIQPSLNLPGLLLCACVCFFSRAAWRLSLPSLTVQSTDRFNWLLSKAAVVAVLLSNHWLFLFFLVALEVFTFKDSPSWNVVIFLFFNCSLLRRRKRLFSMATRPRRRSSVSGQPSL